MNFGYIRVSTDRQNLDSQKNIISRYCVDHKMNIDQWFELEISSRKSTQQRKIHELIDQLNENDSIIVSELSRLGRSIKDVLDIIENITTVKKSRLIVIKQHLDLNHDNNNQTANKILITIFSMLAVCARKHKRHAHLQKWFSCSLILQIRKRLCSLYLQIRIPIPTLYANKKIS